MKKKLLSLFLLLAVTLLTLPAAAYYTCSGPPIATGTVGTMSGAAPNPQYITTFNLWSGPPAEAFSSAVMTNFGGPSKISWAAQSGAITRFGASCTLNGAACVAWPTGTRATTWSISTSFVQESTPGGLQSVSISKWTINGLKVMELYGVGALVSPGTFTDGVSRIRQDTGANSSFFFEGWNTVSGVTTWKSQKVKFVSNQCGSL